MLDAIHNMEQVIYIVCPGSGGYDAVFLLGEEEI
jgi:phosphomevalonate kinase